MVRVSAVLRLLLVPLASLEEPARDLVARAQTAREGEQRGAMLRAFAALHELLVPPLDELIERQSLASRLGAADTIAAPSSACLGLLGLWDELLDIDVERENILELLVVAAARVEAPEALPLPDGLAARPAVFALQKSWLAQVLADRPLPVPQWWRRLTRRAVGPLGDRARLTVERQALRIFEKLPNLADAERAEDTAATTELGEFRAGDRLTLAVQVPLPGQLAVLHASGSAQTSSLEIVLPETVSEAVVRRHQEVVELSGELAAQRQADGSIAEQALVVVWVPELMPPSWIVDMLLRQGVPPEARVWRYLYLVTP